MATSAPGTTRKIGRMALVSVLVAGIAATTLAWYFARMSVQSGAEDTFRAAVDTTIDGVTTELERYVDVAAATRGYVGSDGAVTRREWAGATSQLGLDRRLPALLATNYIRRVDAADLDELVAVQRADGRPDFAIKPDVERDEYRIVTRVAPYETNKAALGLDTGANPRTVIAEDRARDTGQPVLTDPFELVQEVEGQQGFVIFQPLFDGSVRVDATRAYRVQHILGWTNAVFRGQQFLEGVTDPPTGLGFRVIDPVTDNGAIQFGAIPADLDPNVDPELGLRATEQVEVLGQTWQFEFVALPGFVSSTERRAPIMTLGAGALFTLLLVLLVGVLGRSEERANDLVAERTHDLVAVNDRLGETNDALVEANRAKDDFLAVVSHEFRTPLTVIRGFSSMLLEFTTDIDETTRDALVRIERNSERLDDLVGDLLMAARLEAGVIAPEPTTIQLRSLVNEVRADLGQVAGGVEAEVPADARLFCDRGHTRRILSNLISNAYKYGVAPVRITAAPVGDDMWRLIVEDHGTGVPEELVPRLFDRFAQAETSNNRASRGVGLGLAIVRQLAELNGGQALYTGRPGEGARFAVDLPAASADAPVTTDAASATV